MALPLPLQPPASNLTRKISNSEESLWRLYQRWGARYDMTRNLVDKLRRFTVFKDTARHSPSAAAVQVSGLNGFTNLGSNCCIAGCVGHHLSSKFWEFADLRQLISQVERNTAQDDQITRKLTTSGQYMASLAYKTQFIGCMLNLHLKLIWETWAPPKCKFFAWLIIQNRVWTSDRLAKRNWDHSPTCPLCRQIMETAHHLLAECRYTKQMWNLVATWTRQPQVRPMEWKPTDTIQEWWTAMTAAAGMPKKTAATLCMLIMWEIWKERNARTFDRRESSTQVLLAKIKDEANAWMMAGAKPLAFLLARE